MDKESVPYGSKFNIGNTTFIGESGLYSLQRRDFTIISTDPFPPEHAPEELKRKLESRWHYALHVSHGMEPTVNRSLMKLRVFGSEIIAYRYVECSIFGNPCVYYGIIPTVVNDKGAPAFGQLHKPVPGERMMTGVFDGVATHRKSRIAAAAVWPRKLYVWLRKDRFGCSCSKDCSLWQVMMANPKNNKSYCVKKIPWSSIYVMMGDADGSADELRKVPRECIVCAQCYDCSKSAAFCRTHIKCKHTKATLFNQDLTPITDSEIKKCLKYR